MAWRKGICFGGKEYEEIMIVLSCSFVISQALKYVSHENVQFSSFHIVLPQCSFYLLQLFLCWSCWCCFYVHNFLSICAVSIKCLISLFGNWAVHFFSVGGKALEAFQEKLNQNTEHIEAIEEATLWYNKVLDLRIECGQGTQNLMLGAF